MTTKFNVGDVVRLKSGGPEMTIFIVSEGSSRPIYCSWFNGATILHHGDDSKLTGFKPEMLDLVRAATTSNLDSPLPSLKEDLHPFEVHCQLVRFGQDYWPVVLELAKVLKAKGIIK